MTPYSTYKAVSLWLEMSSSCKAQTVVKGTFGNLPSGWSHLDCDYPPEYLVKDSATKISLRGPFQVAFADQGKSRLSNILEDGETLERTFMSSLTGTLYLYVDLDEYGNIRRVNVLKDPGYGFADAAVAALEGITCKPAMMNDKPVAVRFRYPVRFVLS